MKYDIKNGLNLIIFVVIGEEESAVQRKALEFPA